jgi:SAM-dependent methyltransferase
MTLTSISKAGKGLARTIAAPLLMLGIDPRRFAAIRHLPRYLSQYRQFQSLGGRITHRYPILVDYEDQAGSARGHYFHQDLLIATFVSQNKPIRHIDIGSRIDGFVAHVAAFRPIEVLDVRELKECGHENIKFLRANLMDSVSAKDEIADSISCLHAIEHFGLGRYTDPLDPQGHLKGFQNILRMLKPNGTLYISFPIGRENEIHFNAHRIFHPKDILNWPTGDIQIALQRFDYVDDAGILHKHVDINNDIETTYGCGIYTFKKIARG